LILINHESIRQGSGQVDTNPPAADKFSQINLATEFWRTSSVAKGYGGQAEIILDTDSFDKLRTGNTGFTRQICFKAVFCEHCKIQTAPF
jgi:hypothetical protein